MKPLLLISILALAVCPIHAQTSARPHAHNSAHVFAAEGDHFTLDGKPFKVISGELHYARVPREYWHARLKMAKAMGLNTIATYVFWNVHEPVPGHYDFTGQYDLAAFIRAAQQEGLYVILRSGPYACAEWDLGGLPAWLLASPESAEAIRTDSPLFLNPAARWIDRLSKEVLPLQLGRGGPILMTQMENEYGQFGDDYAYISSLRDLYLKAGFNGRDSLLYTADNWRHISEGSIPGTFASVNFGIRNHQGGMDALAKARPNQALFVSEYWPGWFDHWGHPHETRPIAPQIEDIDYILHRGAGINIYMFHGGTSFGFGAGSSYINNKFLPDVTSYDYDAPLDESGRATPKYYAYRKELAKFSPCGNESCLPPVPPSQPIITIPNLPLTETATLFENLPKPIASALPAPMEHFGQDFGYILYRTQLPEPVHGNLVINAVHDFAAVYIDGNLQAMLDRRNAALDGTLPPIPIDTTAPARLDILVANDGRVNVDHTMRTETKGITQFVAIDGRPLGDWRIYTLPMSTPPAVYTQLPSQSTSEVTIPRRCGFLYGNTCGAAYTPIDTSALAAQMVAAEGPAKPAPTVQLVPRQHQAELDGASRSNSARAQCSFVYGIFCEAVSSPVAIASPQSSSVFASGGSTLRASQDGQRPQPIQLNGTPNNRPGSQATTGRPAWSEQPPPSVPLTAWPPPAFYRAHFTVTTPGDTFLDTSRLGKGVVILNGHNLGRFWSVGPQRTLYVPGPWLRKGANEIVVFDMLPNARESIEGLDHPILDAPVSDKTVSDQQ